MGEWWLWVKNKEILDDINKKGGGGARSLEKKGKKKTLTEGDREGEGISSQARGWSLQHQQNTMAPEGGGEGRRGDGGGGEGEGEVHA